MIPVDPDRLLYLLGAGVVLYLLAPLIRWTGALLAIGAGGWLVARWMGAV